MSDDRSVLVTKSVKAAYDCEVTDHNGRTRKIFEGKTVPRHLLAAYEAARPARVQRAPQSDSVQRGPERDKVQREPDVQAAPRQREAAPAKPRRRRRSTG